MNLKAEAYTLQKLSCKPQTASAVLQLTGPALAQPAATLLITGLSLLSLGWCIRPCCSGIITDSRLTCSPKRVPSGGLLGLGISGLKILGRDRVNTCP